VSTFEKFDLPSPILQSLKAMSFETPTPIQAQAIPAGLTGKDIMGMAQTGTGKTAAFGIPIAVSLLNNPKQNAVVLAPTRELAVQIHEFFKQLTAQSPQLISSLLIGGTSLKAQFRELGRRPRVLIATPGRLMDHLNRNPKLLIDSTLLAIDEADRMLDMGFAPQLNKIRHYLPKKRQTFMFSATFPANIKKLANEYLSQPVEISVGQASRPVQKIEQAVIETTQQAKNDKLMDELNVRKGSVLIFARTRSRTNRLTRHLLDYGYKVAKIHGDCTQSQRQTAIEGFRNGKYRVLVATDIASRGLDIDDIGHVINYDLPQAPEDYVHRIGRTARNGKGGQSLSLLTPEDREAWHTIARFTGIGSMGIAAAPAGSKAKKPQQQGRRPGARPTAAGPGGKKKARNNRRWQGRSH
jgi:superfamily II DNA/RNA helicase